MQRRELIMRWIAVTILASLVAVLDGGWLAHWTVLEPGLVWRGQVWRLFTWPFVVLGPKALVVTCMSIYQLGGELVIRWGDRRMRRFMVHILGAAAIVTCLVAPLAGGSHIAHAGGWAVIDTLVISWARQFPEARLVKWGLVPLGGRELIGVTIAITVVFAIYVGPIAMAPELVACAAAALYPRGWLV